MKGRHRYKQSFLIQLVVSYVLLLLVLLTLCGGLLYFKAKAILLDEVSQEGRNRLENVRNFVEDTLLQRYEDLLLNKVLATLNPQNLDEITYFLSHSLVDQYYRIYRLQNELALLVQANQGLSGITVDFKHSGFIVDDRFFYTKEESSPEADLLANMERLPKQRWTSRVTADSRRVLTYVYTLPYKATESRVEGYLLIDINLPYLEKMASQLLTSPSDKLLIVDATGRPILNEVYLSEVEPELLQSIMQKAASGFEIRKSETDTTVFSYSKRVDSRNDWIYIIIRPMTSLFISSKSLQNDILLICGFVLMIGFVIVFWLSRYSYRPLRNVVRTIRQTYGSLLPTQTEPNEYGLIDQTLRMMDRNITLLKVEAKDAQIGRLLSGNIGAIEDFAFVEQTRVFAVVHIRLWEGDPEQFKERFPCLMREIRCDAVVGAAAEVRMLCKSASPDDHFLARIITALEEARRELDPVFRFAAGIGEPCDRLEDIAISDRQAAGALRYSFLYGSEVLVAFSAIELCKELVRGIVYEGIQCAVKSGNSERTHRLFVQIHNQLQMPNLQVEAVDLALLRIFTSLSETIVECDMQHVVAVSSDLFKEYKKETLEETLVWFETIAIRLTEYFGKDSPSLHKEAMHGLKTYIDEHLQEDISLDLLSSLVDLSPAYISILFKEVLHVSFSDYLTKIRMERAKELLVKPGLSVTKVAGLVGYRNVQYFCTKFKVQYEITPNQFKNAATF